jgi:hypothetical protein
MSILDADNIVLEHLRLLGAEMVPIADKKSESVGRLFAIERHNASTTREIAIVAPEIAEICPSINRHDERLARIERHLSLIDA